MINPRRSIPRAHHRQRSRLPHRSTGDKTAGSGQVTNEAPCGRRLSTVAPGHASCPLRITTLSYAHERARTTPGRCPIIDVAKPFAPRSSLTVKAGETQYPLSIVRRGRKPAKNRSAAPVTRPARTLRRKRTRPSTIDRARIEIIGAPCHDSTSRTTRFRGHSHRFSVGHQQYGVHSFQNTHGLVGIPAAVTKNEERPP